MKGVRKSKNRYQINLYTYTERLKVCTSEVVKKKLRIRIQTFKRMIKIIEKRENRIKEVEKEFIDYYGLSLPISEYLLSHKKGDFMKMKSLFLFKMHKEGISSTTLLFYYNLPINIIKFSDIKKKQLYVLNRNIWKIGINIEYI